MDFEPLLRLSKGVSLVEAPPGAFALQCGWGSFEVHGTTPGLVAALRALAGGGATEQDLGQLVLDLEGSTSLAFFYYRIKQWIWLGLLTRSVVARGEALLDLVPTRCGYHPLWRDVSLDARFQLSRFALLRRVDTSLILESPLSSVQARLPGRSAGLLAALARPQSCRDLCHHATGLPVQALSMLLSLLADAALIREVDGNGQSPEDGNPTLAQWEFHDLLFHVASRGGRLESSPTPPFRFLGTIPPLPATKRVMSSKVIALYKPALGRMVQQDPPLADVMERRRSIRRFGSQPITGQQVGEFLYRVARIRRLIEPDPSSGLYYQASDRPYPSAGAAYDIEIYPIIRSCEGIRPGAFHYDPQDHQLECIADYDSRMDALVRDARHAAGLSCDPQILLVLASRFQRVSWKYSGIAYSLTLKHVGVLFESMYLVATAMGLAPCALGAGNSTVFNQVTGLSPLEESSVGEFLLGSMVGTER
jgi:SagB-type dehydrogenase family enzyme